MTDDDANRETVPWGGQASALMVRRAADQIVFVHKPKADASLEPARHAIREARLVCFLGFGFHPANLDAISTTDRVPGAATTDFIASGLDFSRIEAQAIEAQFPLPGKGLEICEGLDCLRVLKEHPFLHGLNLRHRGELGAALLKFRSHLD